MIRTHLTNPAHLTNITNLLEAAAADYYPGIGFSRHTSAWVVAADDPIGLPRTDTAG